ncbi:LLM class flavin-dependent oxidoreductase [Intrasporangium sp.]|uniref:LLM class flavin-dependent oxidoreductase n=1 Tax=Intrasporangium sp. TaxID=1925024 RepID=UPI0032218DEE
MGKPLRVGVQLPEVERRVEWPELLAMARAAEDVGLDSVWLGDHLLYDLPGGVARGPWEVWTSLAAIAAVTSRVELGPLVASTSFHAPAMLAKLAATVDGISGGRLVLGLGAGWNEREYAAYGFPFDRRTSRFEEAFTIIRTLLRTGRIDHHGRFYDAAECILDPGPTRPGGPPLMLGSTGPRMMRIGLPHVDLWNTWWSDYANSPTEFARLKERVDAAAVASGRRPGEVGATAAVYVRLAGGRGRVMGDSHHAATVEPVAGDPGAIAEHLHAMAEAGAVHVQLVLDPITVATITVAGRASSILQP